MAEYKLNKGNKQTPFDYLPQYTEREKKRLEETEMDVNKSSFAITFVNKSYKKNRAASLIAYIFVMLLLSVFIIERTLFGGFFTVNERIVGLISAIVFLSIVLLLFVFGVIVKPEYRRNTAALISYVFFLYASFIAVMSVNSYGVKSIVITIAALFFGLVFYSVSCMRLNAGKSIRAMIFTAIAFLTVIASIGGSFAGEDTVKGGMLTRAESYSVYEDGVTARFNGRDLTVLDAFGIRLGETYEVKQFISIGTSECKVAYIGSGAFSGDHSVENVKLPQSVTYIYPEAFKGSAVKNIYLSSETLYLSDCFEGSDVESIYLESNNVAKIVFGEGWTSSGKVTFKVPAEKLAAYRAINPLIADLFVAI